MQLAEQHALTEAEYLTFEETAALRHEYVGSEAYAMSGGSQRHNRISINTASLLLARLAGKPCQVFMSDMKLRVARDCAYYYPDVVATCSEQAKVANEAQVVSDPVLVIEVLSPSTEATDRREKLHAYRHLPSLREYVLISQDRQQVEIYRRQGDLGWLFITYEPGDTVEFAAVGVTLQISDLYAGTDIIDT